MSFVLGIAIGIAVGWLVPQPQWFSDLLEKIKSNNP